MIGWVVHRAANIFLFLRFVSDYTLLCPALRIYTPSIYQASIDRVHNWFLRFSPHSSKFSPVRYSARAYSRIRKGNACVIPRWIEVTTRNFSPSNREEKEKRKERGKKLIRVKRNSLNGREGGEGSGCPVEALHSTLPRIFLRE